MWALLARGGGCLKIFGQCPYRTNTFQNGAFLRIVFFLLETRLANQSNACFLVLSAGIFICILLRKFVIGHPLLPLNNYVCSSFHFLIPQAVARLSTNKPGIWWIQMLRCFSLHIIMRMRWYGQNVSILCFVLWRKKNKSRFNQKCTIHWKQT